MAVVVFTKIVNLCMAVMARGDGILGTGIYNLLGFQLPIRASCIRKSRLQESAATATAVVIGFVGCHIDEVFLTDDLFHNIPEVIGHGVAK